MRFSRSFRKEPLGYSLQKKMVTPTKESFESAEGLRTESPEQELQSVVKMVLLTKESFERIKES